MKRYLLPLILFTLGLIAADSLFGFDIRELFTGAVNFIRNITTGG